MRGLPTQPMIAGTHLFVNLGTVMEAMLTSTSNTPGHTSRMPGTNAGHLSQTTVGLAWETSNSPAGDNTLCTTALGNGNGVDHIVLLYN